MKKWPISFALALLTLVPIFLCAQAIEWRKSYGDFSPHQLIQWGNDRLVLAGQWPNAAGALMVNFNGDSLAAWRGDSTVTVRIQGMTLDTSNHVLIQFYQFPSASSSFRIAVLDTHLTLHMENPSIDAFGLHTRIDGTVDLIRRETHPVLYAGEILSVWPLLPSYSPTLARDSAWTLGFTSRCWLDQDSSYLFGGDFYTGTDYVQDFATIWDTFYSSPSQSFDPGGIVSIQKGYNHGYLALAYGTTPSPNFHFIRYSATFNELSSQTVVDPSGNSFFELRDFVPTDMGSFLTLGVQLIPGSQDRAYSLLELDSLGSRLRSFPLGHFVKTPPAQIGYAGNGTAIVVGHAADSSFSLTKINLLAVGLTDTFDEPSAFAYPNPCAGRFSLMLPKAALRVRVYDAIGRCVLDLDGDNRVFELPKAGVYVWEAELRGGAVVKGKVVW